MEDLSNRQFQCGKGILKRGIFNISSPSRIKNHTLEHDYHWIVANSLNSTNGLIVIMKCTTTVIKVSTKSDDKVSPEFFRKGVSELPIRSWSVIP